MFACIEGNRAYMFTGGVEGVAKCLSHQRWCSWPTLFMDYTVLVQSRVYCLRLIVTVLTGWLIVALVLTYLKKGDARQTYLESHYSWLLVLWWAFVWLCKWAARNHLIGIPFAYLTVLALAYGFISLFSGVSRLLDARPSRAKVSRVSKEFSHRAYGF